MGEEPDRVAMVSDLRAEAGALRTEMTTMRDQLSARIEEVNSTLSARIDQVETKLATRIEEEGKTTRRHFDVMVEDVKAAVKLVAEVTAHHAVVLDDHEARLTQIDKRG